MIRRRGAGEDAGELRFWRAGERELIGHIDVDIAARAGAESRRRDDAAVAQLDVVGVDNDAPAERAVRRGLSGAGLEPGEPAAARVDDQAVDVDVDAPSGLGGHGRGADARFVEDLELPGGDEDASARSARSLRQRSPVMSTRPPAVSLAVATICDWSNVTLSPRRKSCPPSETSICDDGPMVMSAEMVSPIDGGRAEVVEGSSVTSPALPVATRLIRPLVARRRAWLTSI